ncbi:MAG: TetR/AcrR family transcriptional regulator [Deltaproteobacteria bacterium]|nr:TetR/AcrR family transcriptional regulator [Deltaproteobacteria bacterium]
MRSKKRDTGANDSERPRRRRTPEQARHEILQVAKKHLTDEGPDAIRLHAIAREIGVTHQAILRHFRTREDLMAALLRYAGKRLREELAAAVEAPHRGPADVRNFYDAIDRVFRKRGYARLSAWLVLAGRTVHGSGLYRRAAEAINGRREIVAGGGGRPSDLEDTLFSIVLLALVAWGDALVGSATRRAVGLADHELMAQRFRVWLTNLIDEHLFGAGTLAARHQPRHDSKPRRPRAHAAPQI